MTRRRRLALAALFALSFAVGYTAGGGLLLLG